MKKNSIKNTRINAEVQRELSTLIREECKDPRIHPLTSVLEAEVAPDLKTARIYISVLGDEEALKETLRGLKSAAPHLRYCLAKNMNMRNTPELIFVGDRSIAYGVSMSKMIEEVTAQLPDRSDEENSEESENSQDDTNE